MTDSPIVCIFKKPQYVLHKGESGELIPSYQFSMEVTSLENTNTTTEGSFVPFQSTTIFDTAISEIDLQQQLYQVIAQYKTKWHQCIKDFLQASRQYFAKNYTAEHLAKYIKHQIEPIPNAPTHESESYTLGFIPNEIRICQGQFILLWRYIVSSLKIDIPDIPAEKDVLNSNENTAQEITGQMNYEGLQEVRGEVLPMSTDMEKLQVVMNHSRHIEKRRVQEARLRAKLAQLRAERIMKNYLDKYGDDSCSSDTDDSDNGEDGL